jgi:hypothetical protein
MTNAMSHRTSLSDEKLLSATMTYQPPVILVNWKPIMLYTYTIGGLACEPSSRIMSKVTHVVNNSKLIAIDLPCPPTYPRTDFYSPFRSPIHGVYH